MKARSAFMRASLPFERNVGQTDAAASFLGRGMGYTVFFTRSVVLRLSDQSSKNPDDILRMTWIGGSDAAVQGLEPLSSRSNYYHGNSPSAWHTGVPHYGKVRYRGVYRDTDLLFYGRQRELEYDIVLGPGADPNDVVLQFSGAARLRLNAAGDLVLELRDGHEIIQRRPRIYQRVQGRNLEVPGGYRIMAENRVRFDLGSYDRAAPLVIDPVLAYTSYLGGSGNGSDAASGIALTRQEMRT
jgi:hypothetical protein